MLRCLVAFLIIGQVLASGALAGPHSGRQAASDSRRVEVVTADEWDGVPVLDPIWVLGVFGDTARVIKNSFAEDSERSGDGARFPTDRVQVRKSWTEKRADDRPLYGMSRIFIPIEADGSVRDEHIEWTPDINVPEGASRLSRSTAEGMALVARQGVGEVLRSDGTSVTQMPYQLKSGEFFDAARRLSVVAEQAIPIQGRHRNLEKMLVLEYGGDVLYEGEWTECSYQGVFMGTDPNVVWYWTEGCRQEGEFLLRIDEGVTYSLERLPETGRRFSPDWHHVVVNEDGLLTLYDSSDPEWLRMLWQTRISGAISGVAVSDKGRFVAYRSNLKDDGYRYISVLSGVDGTPVMLLRERKDQLAPGPLVFVGDHLFVGNHIISAGATLDTEHILLFDLGGTVK